ncbi:MAG: hypothetical protein HUU08_06845 [Candidatus Brocadia sp.]|nr:hypothetical protein [Candidatus Brocadia sp.]
MVKTSFLKVFYRPSIPLAMEEIQEMVNSIATMPVQAHDVSGLQYTQ